MIIPAVMKFWAWKMNDYELYNSRYGYYTRWHWYAIVVVCMGLISMFIMDLPRLRNQSLYMAVHENDFVTIREMLDRGADPHYKDSFGRFVESSDLKPGSANIFRTFLEHGAKWNTVGEFRYTTTLTYTLQSGRPYDGYTSILLKHGAKPDFLERPDVEEAYNMYLKRQSNTPQYIRDM
jgi:hypothetical protein